MKTTTTPREILLPLILIFISVHCLSQDIRSNNWGDSMALVKATEKQEKWDTGVSEDGNKYLYVLSKVGGLESIMAWYFVNDKLFSVRYIFTEEHQNKNLYIDDFNTIKDILDAKYGAETTDEIWSNSLYKDDPEDYGMAVSIGHYTMYTQRENEKTSIYHRLNGDNYKIHHVVIYSSKELEEEVSKKSKSKRLSEF